MSSLPLSSQVALAVLGDTARLLTIKESSLGAAVGRVSAPAAGDWLAKAKGKLSGGLGTKGNLALLGGAVAAGTLGTQALRTTSEHMAGEARPQAYGADPERLGYRLPMSVNTYGVPQVGVR